MTYNEFKQNYLPELIKINSFAGKKKYIDNYLQSVGSGTGRAVYDIDGNYVLKLAKNPKGIAQNEAEAGAGSYNDTEHIVAKVIDEADDYSWLISEKGKKVTENRIKQITGIPSLLKLYHFLRNYELIVKGKKEFSQLTKEENDFFWENEFSSNLADFVVNYNQSSGDMGRPSTYGEVLRNGQPSIVLTDYGLNDEVYDTHYNPQTKNKYRMYELYNHGEGNDDVLNDIDGDNDIRKSNWALIPYGVDDGDNVVNEEFINFVSNRNKYPNTNINNLPTLADNFHECVNNIRETLNKVDNKKQFYSNLLELQNYLISRDFYHNEPLLIKEDYPKEQADAIAVEIGDKLGVNPKPIGGGKFGVAYDIGNDKILKITKDNSEAYENIKLIGKPLKYIALPYKVFEISTKSNSIKTYGIILEKLKTNPEYFKRMYDRLDYVCKNIFNTDYHTLIDAYVYNDFDYIDVDKNQIESYLSKNPEDFKFFNGILNIIDELKQYDIDSVEFYNVKNLGYKKSGDLGMFDVGFADTSSYPQGIEKYDINISEDGSAKFSTNNSVGQDNFPPYNINDTSPSINNSLDANISMYEERNKSFGSGSKSVEIKKKCKLGGIGNTSVACNQGDINNLEFKSINEVIDAKQAYRDSDAIQAMINGNKDVALISFKRNPDIENILNKNGWGKTKIVQNHDNIDMHLIYRKSQEGLKKAMQLYRILEKKGGYLKDETPEEAREIGRLLDYTDESIDQYVDSKYNGHINENSFENTKVVDNQGKSFPELDVTKSNKLRNNIMNEVNMISLQELPFKQEVEQLGGNIYSVGGAVRDEFLGNESKDLDILITGIPMDKLEEILSKYGRVDAVGKSFGILKFKPKGSEEDIDVAIPRTEKPTGEGGHKGFEVSSDHALPIEKDLKRRDFTINAIAKDINGNLIDPFHGQEDLKNKIIRVVNPEAFSDDPLRMLRAIQFSSRFGFTIEPKTMEMIKNNVSKINEIAAERILTELDKIIRKGNSLIGVQLLSSTGLFKQIFGNEIKPSQIGRRDFSQVKTMAEFLFLMMNGVVQNPSEFYLKRFSTEDSKRDKTYKELKALETAFNSDLVNQQMSPAIARSIGHNMYSIAPQSLQSQILPEQISKAAQELLHGQYPKNTIELALNGNDLMQKGLQGQQIGQALKSLLIKVYADEVHNTKDELFAALNSIGKKTLNESKENQIEYGALMLFIDTNNWNKYTSLINKNDLYEKNNEFGVEDEPHVTLLYGFKDNVTNKQVFDLYKEKFQLKPIEIEFNEISIFENDDFDVVKFDIKNDELSKINKELRKLPNKLTYPTYHPHMTIAYVKKGLGEKYVKKLNTNLKMIGNKLVFSTKKEKKSILNLNNNENLNEGKSSYNEVKDSLLKSKSIPKEMKEEILKYLTSGSNYHEGGRVIGLIKPKELTEKSSKTKGVSMGADKNGFYVYTHRARSKSHLTPDKITVKEIDFIESTG
jgi:tRNA nucleotidyltransferase/poly(A) polymerase/2'-5' RNA ligase